MSKETSTRFIFRCRTCGEYEVTEASFVAFISPHLAISLREKLNNDSTARAALVFKDKCPKCAESGIAEPTLKVLQKQISH